MVAGQGGVAGGEITGHKIHGMQEAAGKENRPGNGPHLFLLGEEMGHIDRGGQEVQREGELKKQGHRVAPESCWYSCRAASRQPRGTSEPRTS